MAHFIIKAGPDEGSLIPIAGEETSIGRSLSNHIVLNDAAASRSHALILKQGGQYFARDLGSTHGTCINGVRCTDEHPLKDQDLIKIGATVLLFLLSDAQAEIEAPAGSSDNTAPVQAVEGQTVILFEGQNIVFSLPVRPDACEGAPAGPQPPALTRIINATDSLLERKIFLDTLVQQIFEVFTPDRGALLFREKPDGPCLPFIMRPAHKEWRLPHKLLDYAAENRTAVLIDNSDNSTEGVAPRPETTGEPRIAPSALCAPLVYRNNVLGVLYLDSCTGDVVYQKEDLVLLCKIAAYAAASVQRILLIQRKVESERHAAAHEALRGTAKGLDEIVLKVRAIGGELDEALSAGDQDHLHEACQDLRNAAANLSEFVQALPEHGSTHPEPLPPKMSPG